MNHTALLFALLSDLIEVVPGTARDAAPILHVSPDQMPRCDGHSFGWHRHRCANPECGAYWGHDGAELALMDEATHNRAHRCPACGCDSEDQFFCC